MSAFKYNIAYCCSVKISFRMFKIICVVVRMFGMITDKVFIGQDKF